LDLVKGGRVCSIVDQTMDWPVASLTTSEILEVRDGEIVSGEVIFDPEPVRKAMVRATGRVRDAQLATGVDTAGCSEETRGLEPDRKWIG
jgi:hypothetical protein